MDKTVTTYLINGESKGTQYSFISNKICQMFVVPRVTHEFKFKAPDGKSQQLERNSFWFVKRARLKREFEIYRE